MKTLGLFPIFSYLFLWDILAWKLLSPMGIITDDFNFTKNRNSSDGHSYLGLGRRKKMENKNLELFGTFNLSSIKIEQKTR